MKHLSLIASALAVLGLTVCEKGLEDETAVSPTAQVGNSVLQVRTRSGGSGSEATLTDGGTNTVTLGMARRTMLIQDVVLRKIPTAATAVSVTIAPLWQSVTVGGGFATAASSSTHRELQEFLVCLSATVWMESEGQTELLQQVKERLF